MTRSDRMKSIARLAKVKERDAAEALARSNRELSQQERKLAELRSYREDYVRGLEAPEGGTLSAGEMRDIKAFIQCLDQAIAQLEQQRDQKELSNERDKDAWIGTRHRADALDAVVDKYRSAERKATDLEQDLEIDDLVQRCHGK